MYLSNLSSMFSEVKPHGICGVYLEWCGENIWVFVQLWEKNTFLWLCVTILCRYSSNTTREAIILESIADAIGPDVHSALLHAGSHALVEAFANYLRNWYWQKLLEYPLLDLRFFKLCLQRTAANIFGTLNSFFMTNFIVNISKEQGFAIGWPPVLPLGEPS